MQELINKLVEKTGINAEQANSVIQVVKDFAKEKFPMLGGAVDNLFGSSDNATQANGTGGFMDKVDDMLP